MTVYHFSFRAPDRRYLDFEIRSCEEGGWTVGVSIDGSPPRLQPFTSIVDAARWAERERLALMDQEPSEVCVSNPVRKEASR